MSTILNTKTMIFVSLSILILHKNLKYHEVPSGYPTYDPKRVEAYGIPFGSSDIGSRQRKARGSLRKLKQEVNGRGEKNKNSKNGINADCF